MDIFKIGSLLAAAALAACGGAVTLKAGSGTVYYFGEVVSLTPDGRLPYNDTTAALKREVFDGGARIVETLTQPGISPGMSPDESVMELKRRKKTLVYDVASPGGAFSGTVTFKDPGLKNWTYDLKLAGGGEIKGSGSLSEKGIGTEKLFSKVERPMLVKENLKPVSERSYFGKVGAMKPHMGAE